MKKYLEKLIQQNYIRDFYAENYKSLRKYISEVLNKGETSCVHGLEDITY